MAAEAPPWLRPSVDLARYVSANLRQEERFQSDLLKVVRKIVTYIEKNASYSTSRTVLSGDLVSGTTSPDELAEFQISLFIADFRSVTDYRARIRQIQGHTRDLLGAEGVGDVVLLRGRDPVTADGKILVRIMVGEEWVDGLVVPAVDLIGPNPSKSNKETMYRQFMQDEDKSLYQATLNQLRLSLVQSLPTAVKDVILLVKYWRRSRLRLRGDKPAARFFELLAVQCWEMAGRPETFDLAVAIRSVLTCLSHWQDISITWTDSQCLAYPQRIADGKRREILSRSCDYGGPMAIDPIDPRLEYCAGVKTLIWDEISRAARETLMEPLFRELSPCTEWHTVTS